VKNGFARNVFGVSLGSEAAFLLVRTSGCSSRQTPPLMRVDPRVTHATRSQLRPNEAALPQRAEPRSSMCHGPIAPLPRLGSPSVIIPMTETRRACPPIGVIATVSAKSSNRARFLALNHPEPPLFHLLPHSFLHLFNARWRSRRPNLQV